MGTSSYICVKTDRVRCTALTSTLVHTPYSTLPEDNGFIVVNDMLYVKREDCPSTYSMIPSSHKAEYVSEDEFIQHLSLNSWISIVDAEGTYSYKRV